MPRTQSTRLVVATPSGPAWLDADGPAGAPIALLVVGHGAGGGVDAPDIVAVRSAAVAAGVVVVRVTQPYRVAGRRTPAPAARLDEAWLAVLESLRAAEPGELPLITAGRSSGARVACRTAQAAGAVAVVTLAFPVHPPGKPDRSRLDELAMPRVPVLAVQGDRDAFGMPPRDSVDTLVVVPGADHSLKRDTAAVAAAVVSFVRRFGQGSE